MQLHVGTFSVVSDARYFAHNSCIFDWKCDKMGIYR